MDYLVDLIGLIASLWTLLIPAITGLSDLMRRNWRPRYVLVSRKRLEDLEAKDQTLKVLITQLDEMREHAERASRSA